MFGKREDGTANFEKKCVLFLSFFLFAIFSSPSWGICPGVGNSYHRVVVFFLPLSYNLCAYELVTLHRSFLESQDLRCVTTERT